tara:strand:- start:175 stop:324 length:150 start_codon:yes stop_codon:yes gene_type:complete
MNTFYETDALEDALFDIFIDQLHQHAELQQQEDLDSAWVSSSADRATAF